MRNLVDITWDLLVTCMYGHQKDVTLFKMVRDVVHEKASLDAYCEGSLCYLPFGILQGVNQWLVTSLIANYAQRYCTQIWLQFF